MSNFSTPGIILRRIDHGDYDLIISFFTLNQGKVSIIAKSAKKSVKRFQGVLELFSVVRIVCGQGRGRGLPVLQEAALVSPFPKIREDIKKTAYASYWSELLYFWLEEGKKQADTYHLFQDVLTELDRGDFSMEALSVFFQMRFASQAGLSPNLKECCACRTKLEVSGPRKVNLNLKRGGLICDRCAPAHPGGIALSVGTIKQLLWIQERDAETAKRIRLTPQATKEGLTFLESFVPYHMGSQPRSLKFLKQIRS